MDLFNSTLQKLAWIGFGICLMAVATIPSCQGKQNETITQSPTGDIGGLRVDVDNVGKSLDQTTKTIEINANEGVKKTPETARPALMPHWIEILTAAGVQKQQVVNLKEIETRAELAEKKSIAFEKSYETEKKARIAAEDNTTKELREKYLGYSGILFFIALICGGIAIFSGGNKLALYGGILAGAGSAVCIFIVQTVTLIPWIIGGLALVAVALGIYLFLTKNNILKNTEKKVETYKRATEELVETVEATKPRMTTAGRLQVFGDGPTKGDAFAIQSKETESIVKEVRKNIEKAPPVPATVAVDWNGDGVIDEMDEIEMNEKQKTNRRIYR